MILKNVNNYKLKNCKINYKLKSEKIKKNNYLAYQDRLVGDI